MRRLLSISSVMGLSLSSAPFAHAGVWSQALSKCAALLEKPYQELVESNGYETLLLNARNPETPLPRTLIGLSLHKRLGAGFFGQVVIVDQVTDPDLEKSVRQIQGRTFAGPLIVKIPHALRKFNLGLALPYTHAENVGEWKSYQNLVAHASEYAQSSRYPLNTAWKKGTLPLAPISGVLESERGLLIFKPLLRGWDLKRIAEHVRNNGGKLPPEMEQGLFNHYQFIQAVYAVDGFSTDIRPPNLMWLPGDTPEERAQLALLGYSRPGFIAFEMAAVPGNQPHYINGQGLSFEQYRAEFEGYLQDQK